MSFGNRSLIVWTSLAVGIFFSHSLVAQNLTDPISGISGDEDRFRGKQHLLFQKNSKNFEQFKSTQQQIEASIDAELASAAFLTVGSNAECGYATIQDAVDAANSGDTIRVMNETFTADDATFNVINKSLNLFGGRVSCFSGSAISGYTILDGTGMSSADSIVELGDSAGGMDVILSTFKIRFGQDDGNGGGGIEVSGKTTATLGQRLDLRLSNVIVHLNVSGDGGGVHMTNGKLTLSNQSLITTNRATNNGAGVYCQNGAVVVSGDSIIGKGPGILDLGNTADSDGGGVYLDSCDLTMVATNGVTGAYIIANKATDGGGIFATNSSNVELQGDKAWVHLNQATGSGGGFFAESSSVVTGYNSSIKGNIANFGGGSLVKTNASFSLLRSSNYPCQGKCNEFSGNVANTRSGAIQHNGGEVILDGVWIENNYALFGNMLMESWDSVVIKNSMILNNRYPPDNIGSANKLFDVWAGNMALEYNTIAANKIASNGLILFMQNVGASADLDSNIIWDNENNLYPVGGDQSASVSSTNNITDTGWGTNADPLFLVPGSNYHISANSPAVDFGTNTLSSFKDIDGETRGLQEKPDAGADEANARVGINGSACEYASIEAAISAAMDSDTIYISPGNYVENGIAINKSLEIIHADNTCVNEQANAIKANLVVDGSNLFTLRGGLFDIASGNSVTFKNMTLQNAQADYGGIINADTSTTLQLENVHIKGGQAEQRGGGIYSAGVVHLQQGCMISNNLAATIGAFNSGNSQSGGGVAIASTGALFMNSNSAVTDNEAIHSGGGIYLLGTFSLGTNAEISANTARDGGGLYTNSTSNIGISGNITGNSATNGGGIYSDETPINMNGNAIISENDAKDYGGGVYLRDGAELTMGSDAAVNTNTASWGAGVFILAQGPKITVSGGEISSNTAEGPGGGIHISTDFSAGSVFIQSTRFSQNQAEAGGAISFDTNLIGGSLEMDDLMIQNNLAKSYGGGIYIDGQTALSALSLSNAFLFSNTARSTGGGIQIVNDSVFEISDSAIDGNSSITKGGAVFMNDGAQLIANNTRFDANESPSGGGIYVHSRMGEPSPAVLLENGSSLRRNTAEFGAAVFLLGAIDIAAIFTIRDGFISGNNASSSAGAIWSQRGSTLIERSIIDSNTAAVASVLDSSDSITSIQNSIFHSNVGSSVFATAASDFLFIKDSTLNANATTNAITTSDSSSGVQISNSILIDFSDSFSGPANLTASCMLDSSGQLGPADPPLLLSPLDHFYQLTANSPAINKCSTGTSSDFESDSRPIGGGATPYDIGAYEYQTPLTSYTLTVSLDGLGKVTSSPGAIDCNPDPDCSDSYTSGTVVTLTPHNIILGHAFDHWTGDCTGSGACEVTMTAAKDVEAVFVFVAGTIFSDSFE